MAPLMLKREPTRCASYLLAQRGQAPVTLQPDSGLFNSLGAGVVKLTV